MYNITPYVYQGNQKCIRFCLIRFFNFSSDPDLHFWGFLHLGVLRPICAIFKGTWQGNGILDFPDIPRDLGSRAPKEHLLYAFFEALSETINVYV